MKYFFVIFLLFLIIIFGSRHRFRRKHRQLLPRYMILTGTEFILAGYLLSESGLGVLDRSTLEQLQPVLAFALGWVGFIFGIQFDRFKLRQLPRGYFSFSLCQGFITGIFMFSVTMIAGLVYFDATNLVEILIASLLVGGTAACSTQATPAIVARELKVKPRAFLQLVRYIAVVDGIVGVVVVGILFCFIPGLIPLFEWMQAPWKWFVVSVGLGMVLGFVFKSLTFYRFSHDELILIVFGITTFSGGLAFYLHLSPVFITFIMGLVIANTSRDSDRILEYLVKAEHLSYVCILLFAGASLGEPDMFLFVLGLAYFSFRLFGKLAGNNLAKKIVSTNYTPPSYLGAALLAQGGIAIALTVSLRYQYGTPVIDMITYAIIIGIVLSEITGPYFLVRVLESEGGKP